MSHSLEDARLKAQADRRQELHLHTLTLLLEDMIRASGIRPVRELLEAIARDLGEFEGSPVDKP